MLDESSHEQLVELLIEEYRTFEHGKKRLRRGLGPKTRPAGGAQAGSAEGPQVPDAQQSLPAARVE